MWRLLADALGVAALFFMLWVGLWAAHLFGG